MAKDAGDKKSDGKKDAGKGAAKKGGAAKSESTSKKDKYSVEGGKLERKGRNCPKCGPGVFLGEHKDRNSCGKCGYTEFKAKK
jgi:small subunit ribosomal protein S27Ae